MAYSTTSKFVQLTPFLLMEYMYADNPDPETYPVNTGTTTVGYNKLYNSFIKQVVNRTTEVPSVQIYNLDADYDITHNSTVNTVVQIGTNSFVALDEDVIIPFNDFTDNLTPSNELEISFPANILVVYDSIKYHIVAGYNLSNLDGLILSVKYQDVDLTYVTFSQIIIQKGVAQTYTYNPTPLKVGSRIYDKYFEIKVPSLRDMNDRYQAAASSFRDQTLAALTSNSGRGFVYGAPIRIQAWYVRSKVDYNGYQRYNSEQAAELSLESEDPFNNIGATIKESDAGQFFEYFATDNEGFIEDFILFQNSIGNNYYITHQIETLEQIGVATIVTNTFQTIQTTGYDIPNYYRPIIKNASVASSFTLRYTMTLYNAANNQSVVRVGSYTSTNASQWGASISPIKLSTFPQVQKIYNKIYQQGNLTVPVPTNPAPKEILKIRNVFIDQQEISSTNIPLLIKDGIIQEDSSSKENKIAQPAGKIYIDVTPFDNYYKFKIYRSGSDGSPVTLDLGDTSNFNLVFLDNSGNKLYIPALRGENIANPSEGEVAFRVDDSVSMQILNFNDRRFFITQGGDNSNGAQITPPIAFTNAKTK